MNILTYAKNATQNFSRSPFNRVDALIVCWLAYYCYPDYLKEETSVTLKEIENRGLLPDEQMYQRAFNPKTSKKLFGYLVKRERFQDMELFDFREEHDEEKEKQFASVCVKIAPNKYFLAFRGTDPSFLGWKEDFNLSCRYPVPSQEAAVEYVQREMYKFPAGQFYIGGHSKGGNLAMYAAINVDERLQQRIITVFNFDGPGFLNDIYSERGYEILSDRIVKIVPKSSFVGMLMETRNDYSVIKSGSVSVLQHDPFFWTVKKNDFQYLNCRTKLSVKLEKAFNKWLSELSMEERERTIDLIFNALNTLDTNDFLVFFKTFYRQIPALWKEYKRFNAEDKDFFDAKWKRLKQLLLQREQ